VGCRPDTGGWPQSFLLPPPAACFRSRASSPTRLATTHGLRLEDRPLCGSGYRPQTNGKTERFIRTCSEAGPTERSTAPASNAPERAKPVQPPAKVDEGDGLFSCQVRAEKVSR
jgi:hypothetical protein